MGCFRDLIEKRYRTRLSGWLAGSFSELAGAVEDLRLENRDWIRIYKGKRAGEGGGESGGTFWEVEE